MSGPEDLDRPRRFVPLDVPLASKHFRFGSNSAAAAERSSGGAAPVCLDLDHGHGACHSSCGHNHAPLTTLQLAVAPPSCTKVVSSHPAPAALLGQALSVKPRSSAAPLTDPSGECAGISPRTWGRAPIDLVTSPERSLIEDCDHSDADDRDSEDLSKAKPGLTRAQKVLLRATVLAFIFMILEVVGGYISQSVAIASDAAHMFSDVSGYVVALAAAYLSTRGVSKKYHYGYKRVEVLGALLSVLLIWIVTAWLVFEAIRRCFHPEPINHLVMVTTAALGIVFNVLIFWSLGAQHHHHFGMPCSHSHGHSHGSGGCSGGHGHSHSEHSHGQSSPDLEVGPGHSREHDHHGHGNGSCGHGHHNHAHGHGHGSCGHGHHNHGHGHGHGSCGHDHHSHGHGSCGHDQHSHGNGSCGHDHHSHGHGSCGHDHHSHGNGSCGHDHHNPHSQHEHKHARDAAEPAGCDHDHENLNVRGAVLHALGDLLSSIGVLIAGILMWAFPSWWWADPVVTLLFSVLVFWTTKDLIRDICAILMQQAPATVHADGLEAELMAVPGATAVQKLSVWTLSSGHHVMSAHVRLREGCDAAATLRRMEAVCRRHSIKDTTIQVEQQ